MIDEFDGRSERAQMVAEGLTFTYRGGRQALVDVTFSCSARRVALLGPNGAGKSTLLGIVTGARRASGGRIQVRGYDSSDRRQVRMLQRSLGFLPQSFAPFPGYTAEEFLRYVAWLREVPAGRVAGLVEKALATVDLAGEGGLKIRQMSGGMRRRLGLAQALVNEPDVVVLDEPTVGLDPQQRAEFRDALARVGQRSLVLMATHLVEDVAVVCDEVVILDRGKVAFSGPLPSLVELTGRNIVDGAAVEAAYLHVMNGGAA
ncbi:ABC transporter ATP-binding protein [Actinopolymorpha alba]|uniref:ABC transporter ATP-binding protein n=1 Tax=Actinopolymorpha alba TaxID=533267 RepID=UPI00037A88E6|nr:ATP-binding cassette domain-containing protein [Actinopolymorpha alba]